MICLFPRVFTPFPALGLFSLGNSPTTREAPTQAAIDTIEFEFEILCPYIEKNGQPLKRRRGIVPPVISHPRNTGQDTISKIGDEPNKKR